MACNVPSDCYNFVYTPIDGSNQQMKLKATLFRCINNADTVIEVIKDVHFGDEKEKILTKTFPLTQAAKMTGVTREAIRLAEKAGRIEPPQNKIKNRKAYTLEEINKMRDVFNTRPFRKDTDEAFVLLFMNFKGGVRKTTISTLQAQYLALKGYRVLLIDADSQASTTSMFGLTPDIDISHKETLSEYLSGETEDFTKCIRNTYWDGIDLIPANLTLFDVEFDVLQKAYTSNYEGFYQRLRKGIDTVKDDYDFVIIDAPPSLGVMSMNLIYAADGVIVPMPPVIQDFCSTRQFFGLLHSIIDKMESREIKFVKLLISKHDSSTETDKFINYIREVFSSDLMLNNYFRDTAEIPRAAMRLMSVYEQPQVQVKETHTRALKIINSVCQEIENLVIQTWPSRKEVVMQPEEALIW